MFGGKYSGLGETLFPRTRSIDYMLTVVGLDHPVVTLVLRVKTKTIPASCTPGEDRATESARVSGAAYVPLLLFPLFFRRRTYTVEWTGTSDDRFEIDLYYCGSFCMEVRAEMILWKPERLNSAL